MTSYPNQLKQLITQTTWILNALRIVRNLELTDCWIGAGFVRNAVWDNLHDKKQSDLTDIDIIYFNKNNLTKSTDLILEKKLQILNPNLTWSVKNQARMHLRNNHEPYIDCNDAISYWPETATAIAIRLNSKDEIEYLAPYGLDDLFNLILRHSHKSNLESFKIRLASKKWKKKWENLTVINEYNY